MLQFLPIANSTSMILSVDMWVLSLYVPAPTSQWLSLVVPGAGVKGAAVRAAAPALVRMRF